MAVSVGLVVLAVSAVSAVSVVPVAAPAVSVVPVAVSVSVVAVAAPAVSVGLVVLSVSAVSVSVAAREVSSGAECVTGCAAASSAVGATAGGLDDDVLGAAEALAEARLGWAGRDPPSEVSVADGPALGLPSGALLADDAIAGLGEFATSDGKARASGCWLVVEAVSLAEAVVEDGDFGASP